jgi:MscS family membrane protein
MKFLGLTSDQWLQTGISVVLVLFVIVVGRWMVTLILDRSIRRIVGKTQTSLDDVLLDTIRLPLYWLLVILILRFAVERLDYINHDWQQGIDNVFYVLYFIVVFFFAWRFVGNLFNWYGKEIALQTDTDLDEQLLPFFSRVALIILAIIGIITLLGHFDVDVSAMVTTLGIGSLAIALAAQTALADTISGFMIMIDRPFRIGDRIEIRDFDTWGDVVDIGLRSSRIRTRDNRMVIVPNSVIGKSLVVNYSYPDSQYRIEIHIGVGYGTNLEFARQTMIDAVRKVEGVLQDKPVEALFLEFGDSALIFRVRWWIDSYVDTRRMFDAVNSALLHALEDAEIEVPSPQLEVNLISTKAEK